MTLVETHSAVVFWWRALSAIAVVNIALWAWSASALRRSASSRSPEDQAWWRRQLALSAVFVFGCAFRAFLPRADVQRIVLYDSWLSSVFVGRSVATLAELAFMTQMALHLRRMARERGAQAAVRLSTLIVPLIAVAETCSWYAVLTTNYLGNTFEESLWTVSATLLLAGCALLWPRCDAPLKRLLILPFIAAPLYICFMATVDVPMYFTRWRADELAHRGYLPLAAGVRDLATRWVVTRRLEDWRTEMPWMTLYFSAAVWISVALATPRLKAQSRAD